MRERCLRKVADCCSLGRSGINVSYLSLQFHIQIAPSAKRSFTKRIIYQHSSEVSDVVATVSYILQLSLAISVSRLTFVKIAKLVHSQANTGPNCEECFTPSNLASDSLLAKGEHLL